MIEHRAPASKTQKVVNMGASRPLRMGALIVAASASLVVAQGTSPAGTLSNALRAHLQNEKLAIVTSVRGLPLGVRDAMQELFRSDTLDIAEPGAEFQVTDVIVNSKLPIRRLVRAGCSMDHCLVYYERGGIAHTWQAALFHWTPSETRLEGGGAAPGGLADIDAVKAALLAGTIKGPLKFW